MRVSVESTGALERRLKVEVPAERIEKQVEERLRSLGKRARIKGFRPGKAPFKVVQQRYGDEVRQEVLGDVLQSSYGEAISQESLNPAGSPRIETEQAAPGHDLKYTATVEIFPEIELKNLDKIRVERPQVEIGDADVEAMLERLRRQHAGWEAVEREAREGDRVTVDFEGSIDGEPFPGNKGEGNPVELGSGQMLPDFEAGLHGVQPGQALSIDVTFPEGYGSEEVAGKTARFEVKVHTVEAPRLPEVDEAFAEQLGIHEGGVDRLREELRRSMQREVDQAGRSRIKQQALDGLYEQNPVEVPTPLVDEEIDRLKKDTARRMGLPEDQLPDLPRDLFEEQARKRVATGLLVGELIRDKDIQVDRDRLKETVQSMVAGHENAEEMARAYMQNPQVLRNLESMVLEDQVVDWLVEHGQVTDRPMSFDELMNPQAENPAETG